jgi:hypothetical protein
VIDLTGRVLVEIRDYAPVAAITPRVRGGEPAKGDVPPMVILVRAGRTRSVFAIRSSARIGLQDGRWYARCYGATAQQAAQLSGAVSDAIHTRGPRTDSQGRRLYLSVDEGGGDADLDPVTRWPLEVITIRAVGGAFLVGQGAAAGSFPVGGGGDKTYVHSQLTPATVWTIVHNLGKFPAVETSDLARNEIYGDVDWVDLNTVTVTFAGPVDGYAYLN